MAKNTYKVVCDGVNATKQTSQARFIIESKPIPPAEAGQPARRTATTVFIANFSDNAEAMKYKAGQSYNLTIE